MYTSFLLLGLLHHRARNPLCPLRHVKLARLRGRQQNRQRLLPERIDAELGQDQRADLHANVAVDLVRLGVDEVGVKAAGLVHAAQDVCRDGEAEGAVEDDAVQVACLGKGQ